MALNLDIDPPLLKEAVSVGRHRSKKTVVTEDDKIMASKIIFEEFRDSFCSA